MLVAIVAVFAIDRLSAERPPEDASNSQQTDNRAEDESGDRPAAIIPAPASVPTDGRRREDDVRAPEFVQSAAAVVGVLIAFGTFVLLAHTLRQSQRANDLAARSVEQAAETNRVTREAYENDLRPWLTLEDLRIEQIRVAGETIRVAVAADVANLGKTPATTVHLHLAFYRLGTSERTWRSLDAWCAECVANPNPDGRSRVIYPGAAGPFRRDSDRELADVARPPRVNGLRVFACLTYRSPVSDRVFHTGTVLVATLRQPGRTLASGTYGPDDLQLLATGQYDVMA